jgi:ribosomal protein S18 acetylase RimI-like enzyme
MSEAPPLIRPAVEADLDPLRALLRETWHQVYDPILGSDKVGEVTARWHARDLLARQLHQADASFLVACEDERLIAHGYAFVPEPAVLNVSRLYVRPGHQRRGIGQLLLKALCARHPEAETLRLFVAAQNAAGVAFWRGQGFAVTREAIEEGALVLHMEKHLRK